VLFLPVVLISGFHFPRENPVLGGRYVVTRCWINDTILSPGNCGDSVVSRVYFDRGDHCTWVCRDTEKMRLGNFIYDEKSSLVRVSWYYPVGARDSLVARVRPVPGGLGLDGRMGEMPVRLELARKP
jgi:hypothetical protein